MKRARTSSYGKDSLTGGTGDVNPQYLSDTATQSAADTTTTTQVTLPIQRISANAPSEAIIMEVLKIFVNFPQFPAIAAVAETTDTMNIAFSTRNTGTTNQLLGEPSVFAFLRTIRAGAFTAGGTYWGQETPVQVWDCTDGSGHGILIATDSIFVQVTSAGTGNANTVQYKILYRWKRVSLPEYIGIVQSQQQG